MSEAVADAAIRAALSHWLGLPLGSCRVLCALYRAGGRPLSAADLALSSANTRKGVVNHHLHCLRQSLSV